MGEVAKRHNGAAVADWRLHYARDAVIDICTFATVSLRFRGDHLDDEQLQAACLARILQLAEVAISALSDECETRANLHRKLTGLLLPENEGGRDD